MKSKSRNVYMFYVIYLNLHYFTLRSQRTTIHSLSMKMRDAKEFTSEIFEDNPFKKDLESIKIEIDEESSSGNWENEDEIDDDTNHFTII